MMLMKEYLFFNGSILTMNAQSARAEAVLVQHDRIVFVGTEQEAKTLASSRVEAIDLQGQCLMPGFQDSHVHLVQHGFERSQIDLSQAKTKAEGLEIIRKAAEQKQQGDWILGSGFLMSRWSLTELHKEDLDAVAAHNPVLLRSQDHHSAWVNSLALKQANINAASQNPKDGEIVKNPNGEPTGLLLEQALELVSSCLPELSDADIAKAVNVAGEHFASLGITSVHSMAAEPESYWRVMASMASKPEYFVRVWACIPQKNIEDAAAIGLASNQGGEHFQIGGAKFFADGALGSLTAHMLEPYEGRNTRGVEVDGYSILKERFPLAIKAGLVPVTHAIGDAANQAVLNALEETKALWQAKNMRPRIEHAQHLAPKDLKRFAEMGVIAAMQPIHFKFDAKSTARLLGERINTTHAWRSLTDSGVNIALGSDTPVASPDVFEGLATATSRRSEEGDIYGASEALSMQEALEGYTKNAAYAIQRENRSGQLKAGFDADFVILSQNPLDSLEGISVKASMKAGSWMFQEG